MNTPSLASHSRLSPARILALAVLAVLPLLGGCVIVAAGAAGAGAVAYVRGEMQSSVEHDLDATFAATQRALKELQFARIDDQKTGIDALLVSRTALDKRVEIKLKKITDTLWVLKDKQIGVLGLAFKQNTDDVRSSPAIELCQRLLKEGAKLRVHDPKAMEKAKAILPEVTYVEDMNAVAEGCDALVVATEWDEFKQLDVERARQSLTHPILFDGRNLFDAQELEAAGWVYKSVGR